MATEVVTLLAPRKLNGDETQSTWEVLDGAGYITVEILFQLLAQGSGGTLILEHAPELKEALFVPLTGASLSLNGTTGNTHVHIASFMRYIRWKCTSAAGGPIAGIILVAKD